MSRKHTVAQVGLYDRFVPMSDCRYALLSAFVVSMLFSSVAREGMVDMNSRTIRLVPMLAAFMSGCGGSDNATDGKWLEAPDALAMYLADPELMSSGRDKEGCPVKIDKIRADLQEGVTSLGTRQIQSVCSNAGMAFGNEARCEGKRLQVQCL